MAVRLLEQWFQFDCGVAQALGEELPGVADLLQRERDGEDDPLAGHLAFADHDTGAADALA